LLDPDWERGKEYKDPTGARYPDRVHLWSRDTRGSFGGDRKEFFGVVQDHQFESGGVGTTGGGKNPRNTAFDGFSESQYASSELDKDYDQWVVGSRRERGGSKCRVFETVGMSRKRDDFTLGEYFVFQNIKRNPSVF
jgi:hypothetical protein